MDTWGAMAAHHPGWFCSRAFSPAMNDWTAESCTARGPGPSTQAGSGCPVIDKVPMGMELVARVRPSDWRAAGAGTVGGVAEAGTSPTTVAGPFLAVDCTSVAVTRYRLGVNHRAFVGQQVTRLIVGLGVL